ncbi:MAG: CoA transferase, partial [Rhodospirillales bacterium]|nr:CoA transferase [Rhodospirillales bacterium]
MTELARSITAQCWAALGGDPAALDRLEFSGAGGLASQYATSDLAAASVATAGLALGELAGADGVAVDRRLASFWFAASLRPQGWAPPDPLDPVIGDYRAADGWIRLHTNAPHHRAASLRVLGCAASREAVGGAVARWGAQALEAAVVESGGCAAALRGPAEWAAHPQGLAIAAEPLIHQRILPGRADPRPLDPARPLAGIRVLDLTRVLAGPVASRFLAGFGAEVLRIDPPDWQEPGLAPEVTLGKSCARLDLHSPEGRRIFETLLAGADVFLNGYRPGALDELGFGAAARRALAPGLVDVCLCAYGWSGPWTGRRGFDSLVQMSTGLAEAARPDAPPTPLPVQALDHATGYLMAATAIAGLARRRAHGHGTAARLSLARTAWLLAGADVFLNGYRPG